MEIEQLHAPGEGTPKNSTQMISLFVGGLLFILGLSGILFSGFAGLHLSPIYSTIIAASGVILFYNGYKNNSRDAFLSCLIFTLFFGLHALAGWLFGDHGVPRVGHDRADSYWLVIIPNFHELGRNDHILNTILALVLLGGTIDWWRRHSYKGHRTEVLRDMKEDYRMHHHHPDQEDSPPLHH
ncbi:MAG: hypothetical protein ACLGHN_04300 [Bacteriovoracia bacterium]